MEIEDLVLKFTTTRMRLKLDNLFKGDKALGKLIYIKTNLSIFHQKDILFTIKTINVHKACWRIYYVVLYV